MLNKTLTYTGFTLATALIVAAFITSKTYTQLGIAVVLYPLLVYFAFKLFPRKPFKSPAVLIQIPARQKQKAESLGRQRVEVTDIDKRTFLKLIGTAGISFFLISLLGRRVESMLFDKNPQGQSGQAEPTPKEGYKISEIDEGIVSYYGFVDKDGRWLIMKEDTANSTYRYSKGDSGFTGSWSSRENLTYDYYHKLF